MEAIVVEELTRYYGNLLAVDHLSLKVKQRKRIALLGPNGAGKSTVLKVVCGLLRPSGGLVMVDGIDVTVDRERALKNIGALIETPEFYPFFTPEEVLEYLGRLRGMGEEELKTRIREVLELVGLEQWKHHRVGGFSRGMKQRLALAQALLHDPPILVLDEPALGLDPWGMGDIRRILKTARRGKTIFLASHMLVEVEQICEEVAVIDQGRLKAFEPISKLKRKYRSFEQAYLKFTEGGL